MNLKNHNHTKNGINSRIQGLNLTLLLEIARKGFIFIKFMIMIFFNSFIIDRSLFIKNIGNYCNCY